VAQSEMVAGLEWMVTETGIHSWLVQDSLFITVVARVFLVAVVQG
jgi:hypothetical protein